MVGRLFMYWTHTAVGFAVDYRRAMTSEPSPTGTVSPFSSPASPSFAAALATGAPLVLDGGMSNQLGSAGHDLSDELWSARLLAEQPEAIVEAHLAYYEAGADVAITSSYQATFEGFAQRGIGRGAGGRAARPAAWSWRARPPGARGEGRARPLWVAASVGPYGAMLADGSRVPGAVRAERARSWSGSTGRGWRCWPRPAPDVLALETVPDADEAEALLRAVRGLGVPAWLSYSVAGDRTRAGQPLEEAFALAAEADEVIAVGVNCCAPEDVDARRGDGGPR